MLKEPIIVFTNEAAAGRELAEDMGWLFGDGSTRNAFASEMAKAFRDGLVGGIVITYHFASMGLSLKRKDSNLAIIGNPSSRMLYQAINIAGYGGDFFLGRGHNIESIDDLREKFGLKKSLSRCSCTSRTLFNHGCQCGGA